MADESVYKQEARALLGIPPESPSQNQLFYGKIGKLSTRSKKILKIGVPIVILAAAITVGGVMIVRYNKKKKEEEEQGTSA